jgi:hypothetical protein
VNDNRCAVALVVGHRRTDAPQGRGSSRLQRTINDDMFKIEPRVPIAGRRGGQNRAQ